MENEKIHYHSKTKVYNTFLSIVKNLFLLGHDAIVFSSIGRVLIFQLKNYFQNAPKAMLEVIIALLSMAASSLYVNTVFSGTTGTNGVKF